MHVIRDFIIAPLWLGLNIVTVRAMIAYRRRASERYVYQVGMLQFGVSGWIIAVVVGLIAWGGDTQIPLFNKAIYLAFYMFPITIWGGYVWAKAMAAIFPRLRGK
jgi:hypothetical protein